MAKPIMLYQGLCLGTVEGWIFRSHLLHYFLPTSYVSLMHKSRRKGKRSKVMYHVPSLIERVQRIRKALLIQFCLHFFANCNDRKPVKRMLCGSFIFNDRKNQKLTLVATRNSKLWGSMYPEILVMLQCLRQKIWFGLRVLVIVQLCKFISCNIIV